jgi:peptidoglycan/LPS O-acetylase OafA/YrhL
MARLRARRRAARRRRRLLRIDLALGVLAAVVALIVSPGLAIASLFALAALAACALSMLLAHVRRTRAGRRAAPGGGARVRGHER